MILMSNNLWPNPCKLAWAIPHTMSTISSATHYSLMGIKRPPNIEYLTSARGSGIAEIRENQVEVALKLNCTHIWFADGDMAFPEDTLVDLFKLIKDGTDLAGGLCYRGYIPFEPIAWHPKEKRMLYPLIDFNFGDIIEARATGAACLLVRADVFRALPKPWFLINRNEEGRVTEGEDYYFTSRAVDHGFKLLIHTAYDIDHMREFPVNREIFLLSNIFGKILGKEKNWERVTRLWKKVAEDPGWIDRVLSDCSVS